MNVRDMKALNLAPGEKRSLGERFERFIYADPNCGCWLWGGALLHNGYGAMGFGRRTLRAHRLAWALFRGPIAPPGAIVRHRCDNRACVNPDHLETGTAQDNQDDMHKRGRGVSGRLPFGVVQRGRRFGAQAVYAGKCRWAGTYDTPAEACDAALNLKKEMMRNG